MSNAITKADTGILARYGSEQEIQTFMQRAAAIFQIPAEELQQAHVQASLTKATQLCLQYGYLPGVHVHMIPFNRKMKVPNPSNPNQMVEQWVTTYAPDTGEKAWKDSADRISQMQRFSYTVQTREMTAAEVKAATEKNPGQPYNVADAGCAARVLRSDHAALYKLVGDTYSPEWVYGFWRKQARQKGQEWTADSVPVGRSPMDVARRRATKAALMAVFHLVPLDEYSDSMRFRQIAAYVEEESAPTPSPMPVGMLQTSNGYTVDEDGEIWAGGTWEEARPRLIAEETAKMKSEPIPAVPFDDEDNPFADAPARPQWATPAEAKAWAIESGSCQNEFEASASLKKIVDAHGGRLTPSNFAAVMDAFHARQLEKLASK